MKKMNKPMTKPIRSRNGNRNLLRMEQDYKKSKVSYYGPEGSMNPQKLAKIHKATLLAQEKTRRIEERTKRVVARNQRGIQKYQSNAKAQMVRAAGSSVAQTVAASTAPIAAAKTNLDPNIEQLLTGTGGKKQTENPNGEQVPKANDPELYR